MPHTMFWRWDTWRFASSAWKESLRKADVACQDMPEFIARNHVCTTNAMSFVNLPRQLYFKPRQALSYFSGLEPVLLDSNHLVQGINQQQKKRHSIETSPSLERLRSHLLSRRLWGIVSTLWLNNARSWYMFLKMKDSISFFFFCYGFR